MKTTPHNCIISLVGCDDETEFGMLLTEDEIALLQKIAAKSLIVSTYDCMPVMKVKTRSMWIDDLASIYERSPHCAPIWLQRVASVQQTESV